MGGEEGRMRELERVERRRERGEEGGSCKHHTVGLVTHSNVWNWMQCALNCSDIEKTARYSSTHCP